MTAHMRKCWDCGNVAEHSDNIVPEVLCKKCGSQDTRLIREKPQPPRYSIGECHEGSAFQITIRDRIGRHGMETVATSSKIMLPQIEELVRLANIGQLAESKGSR